MTTFFTADTHFGHANVIKHSGRPFASVEEMDAALVANWNAVVKKGDNVFHLGDFAWRNAASYRDQLQGNIHLIIGNHESAAEKIKQRFMWVKDVHMIKVRGTYFWAHAADPNPEQYVQRIWLSHYSHEVWNLAHHGAWHLYGHSHNTLLDRPSRLSMDVGVDAIAARLKGIPQGFFSGEKRAEDYRPFSFEEVQEVMSRKTWAPVDHHGADCG